VPDRERRFRYVYDTFRSWFPKAELLISDSSHPRFSRSGSRNAAVRAARSDVVVICDADTLPQEEVLKETIEAARSDHRLHLPYDFYRGLNEPATQQVLAGKAELHTAQTFETGDTS